MRRQSILVVVVCMRGGVYVLFNASMRNRAESHQAIRIVEHVRSAFGGISVFSFTPQNGI